jgi:hypothetical protein
MEAQPHVLRMGFWAALLCAVGAVGYGVGSVLVGTLAPEAITWKSLEQFVADYRLWPTLVVLTPPFVVTLVYPVLVLAVHAVLPETRRPLTLIALVFAGVYTAVLGSAYWLQLTNVPWNILRGTPDRLAVWVVWNPASLFWSLETFGYFAMGVSGLFLGLALVAGTVPRLVRRTLIAMGPLGVLFLAVAFKDLVFEATGIYNRAGAEIVATVWALSLVFAWVILFGFISFALARWFAGLRSHADPITPADHTRKTGKESTWQPA